MLRRISSNKSLATCRDQPVVIVRIVPSPSSTTNRGVASTPNASRERGPFVNRERQLQCDALPLSEFGVIGHGEGGDVDFVAHIRGHAFCEAENFNAHLRMGVIVDHEHGPTEQPMESHGFLRHDFIKDGIGAFCPTRKRPTRDRFLRRRNRPKATRPCVRSRRVGPDTRAICDMASRASFRDGRPSCEGSCRIGNCRLRVVSTGLMRRR